MTLHAPLQKPITTKLAGSCIYGAFGPSQHLFLACELDEQQQIVELSVPDLAVVRRHATPAIGGVNGMLRAGDALLVMNASRDGWYGALLDAAWLAASPAPREVPMVYAWPTFGILQGTDGRVTIRGDEAAATYALRCFDGAKLRPFDECRIDVLQRP